jgi:hypothetical protein
LSKSCLPLSGRGNAVEYWSVDDDLVGSWNTTKFKLSDESLNSILSEFSGRTVKLGSTQGVPEEGSFGAWILDNGWQSARWASAIAAILNSENLLSAEGVSPIVLTFNE